MLTIFLTKVYIIIVFLNLQNYYMEKLVLFSTQELAKITNHRSGEIKFGEKIGTIPKDVDVTSYLSTCDAQFVLVGIPEDVGVYANLGRRGAASAWEFALKSIANLQHNRFCKGNSLLILGHIDVEAEMKEVDELDISITSERLQISQIVERIDKEVSHIIFTIVKAGKIPIVIGGGHNNAYGNLKGTALAKGKPINAINFDAHSDFRILEGRHSGNGFSYAYEEGFLKKYFIFGLHENYTSKNVLDSIKKKEDRIQFVTYDSVAVRKEQRFSDAISIAENFIKQDFYGIEIDLDSVPNIASSAMTPSGFSVERVRQFVSFFGKNANAAYLHICEGAPDLDAENNRSQIGKLIAYLVTDFIKSATVKDRDPQTGK